MKPGILQGFSQCLIIREQPDSLAGWWLYTQPSEKYDFVNWDDYKPNLWENKKWQPNHQPARYWCSITANWCHHCISTVLSTILWFLLSTSCKNVFENSLNISANLIATHPRFDIFHILFTTNFNNYQLPSLPFQTQINRAHFVSLRVAFPWRTW